MRFSDLNKRLKEDTTRSFQKLNSFKKDPDKDKEQGLPTETKNEIRSDFSKEIKEKVSEEKELVSEVQKKEIRFSIKREEKVEDFDEETYMRRTENSYSLLISSMKNVIDYIYDSSYLGALKEIEMLSNLIVDEVTENRYILNFLRYLTPKNYIISHSVNLSLIASGISMIMGFDKEFIKRIAISSLCIDLGMLYYKDLFSLERKLSNEEFEIIKSHVDDSIEIASKIFAFEPELKRFVKKIIERSHERHDGTGYFGVSGDELGIEEQIVAISDVYEALIHKRPWREEFEEAYAVSFIIREYQDKFERSVIQRFVKFIGIYPQSSIVRLNTGEIGKVVLNRDQRPTKPIVKILTNKDSKTIEPYNLDLLRFPASYIERWVSMKELKVDNPDLYRAEVLNRLWLWI